jgi:hypothetical protein
MTAPTPEPDVDFLRLIRPAGPADRALAKAAIALSLAVRCPKAPIHIRTDIVMAALACYKHELMAVIGMAVLGREREHLTDQESVSRLAKLCLVSLDAGPSASNVLLNLCEALQPYLEDSQP